MKKSCVTNQENLFGMINYNTNIINKYIKMHSPQTQSLVQHQKIFQNKQTNKQKTSNFNKKKSASEAALKPVQAIMHKVTSTKYV
jgi:hypothetical protein